LRRTPLRLAIRASVARSAHAEAALSARNLDLGGIQGRDIDIHLGRLIVQKERITDRGVKPDGVKTL